VIEDEIDLRRYLPYVRGVLRYWPLIAALTLIAAAGAAVISLQQHDVYEAVALISVSTPRYNLQPDSGSPNSPLPVHAYPELAQSDDVLSQVLSRTQALLPASGANKTATLADLQGQLTAEAASDPSLVRLKVRNRDPQIAAELANTWAEVFAARAGALYGQDQANLQLYTSQLAQAKTALDTAESDLAAFQSSNQVTILTAHLDSQQASITDYLNRRHELDLLGRDARDLVAHLSALPASAPASPVEDLALLAITSRLYGSESTFTRTAQLSSGLPMQVQLPAGQPLAGPAVADQLALASSLSNTIGSRLGDIDGLVAALQPQVLALQGQVAESQVKQDALALTRDLASSAYKKLANQVQDATLVAQASSNTVQIASRAELPGTRVSPHRSTSILLGGAVGFALGVVLALAISLWRAAPAPGQAASGSTTPA
jgi:polysaccharide biosynthesis transport protein